MSKQVTAVPVAVMEGVEPSVATTVTEPVMPAVDRGLVAQLVGDAQRQGLPVDGEGGLLAEHAAVVAEIQNKDNRLAGLSSERCNWVVVSGSDGAEAAVESDVERIECLLPALGPSGSALAGGVQGHHGEVDPDGQSQPRSNVGPLSYPDADRASTRDGPVSKGGEHGQEQEADQRKGSFCCVEGAQRRTHIGSI